MIKTPLRGRKDPLKFASLPTCGFVAQLVERPTSIREARVQSPSKPEFFFSGFFFCNFFNCSLPARINSLLITRRSKYDLFHILFVVTLTVREHGNKRKITREQKHILGNREHQNRTYTRGNFVGSKGTTPPPPSLGGPQKNSNKGNRQNMGPSKIFFSLASYAGNLPGRIKCL